MYATNRLPASTEAHKGIPEGGYLRKFSCLESEFDAARPLIPIRVLDGE